MIVSRLCFLCRYQVKSMSRTLQEVGTEVELGDNEELFVSVDSSMMHDKHTKTHFPPPSPVIQFRSRGGCCLLPFWVWSRALFFRKGILEVNCMIVETSTCKNSIAVI